MGSIPFKYALFPSIFSKCLSPSPVSMKPSVKWLKAGTYNYILQSHRMWRSLNTVKCAVQINSSSEQSPLLLQWIYQLYNIRVSSITYVPSHYHASLYCIRSKSYHTANSQDIDPRQWQTASASVTTVTCIQWQFRYNLTGKTKQTLY